MTPSSNAAVFAETADFFENSDDLELMVVDEDFFTDGRGLSP